VLGRGISTVVQRAFTQLHDTSLAIADRQARFVAAFGHRASHDFELSEPRYGEAPATVQALAAGARDGAPMTTAAQPVVDLPGGRLCRLAVARARRFQELKEESKSVAAHDLALLRKLLLAIGSRTGLGDDVFFLLPAELPSLTETTAVAAAAGLAAQRRRDLGWLRAVPLADIVQMADLTHLGEERPIVAQGSGLLRGTRVAGDREVVGRVVVMQEPNDLASLTADDILITRCTDPAWMPAFRTVAGLVTEVGGWLSHGAIQAREQNLPAIVGVIGATQRLHTGMKVRLERNGSIAIVDGTSDAQRQAALAAAK
jgi:rifampicin phosphotransferase